MTAPSPGSSWSNYRLRLWSVLGLSAALLGFLLPPLIMGRNPGEGPVGWIAMALLAANVWHYMYRCPACGEHFFRKGVWQNVLARRCLHCGLPKYQVPT